jgi:hypothetical protein
MLFNGSISFDDSLWPLVVIRFIGETSDIQFEEYLERRGTYLQRRERHLVIVDSSRASMPTARQRQRKVAWRHEHADALDKQVLGVVYVVTSPIIRLSLVTILQLRPLSAPYFIASDMPSAMGWAVRRFEEEGLTGVAGWLRSGVGAAVPQSA